MAIVPLNTHNVRHHRAARKAAMAKGPQTRLEYQIIHPSHTPDLRGEFAGASVYRRGADQFVRLTENQAKFYTDQGAIKRVAIPAEPNK